MKTWYIENTRNGAFITTMHGKDEADAMDNFRVFASMALDDDSATDPDVKAHELAYPELLNPDVVNTFRDGSHAGTAVWWNGESYWFASYDTQDLANSKEVIVLNISNAPPFDKLSLSFPWENDKLGLDFEAGIIIAEDDGEPDAYWTQWDDGTPTGIEIVFRSERWRAARAGRK
jgi:hypothetical protein